MASCSQKIPVWLDSMPELELLSAGHLQLGPLGLDLRHLLSIVILGELLVPRVSIPPMETGGIED